MQTHENNGINPVMGTYNRSHLSFVRGDGAWLETETGDRYLDFTTGIAVNSLGHAHPKLVAALIAQAEKLWHVSNLYTVPEQQALAARLTELTFAEKIFFCNSGAEAIEGSIKTARKYFADKGDDGRYEIICFEGAFHGRTLAALAATGNADYLNGFGPPLAGFKHVDSFDIELVKAAITPATAAILIEPIQGEGGVVPVPLSFLKHLRELCDSHGLLLIFDEVQCGIGRTGKLFAHQWTDITPDIMSVAKGIGGGFPLGAILATEAAATGMVPGTHGSTYGGNPLGMAVGKVVIDTIAAPEMLETICKNGLELKQKTASVIDRFPDILSEIRGEGLMLGLKAVIENKKLVEALRVQKLLTVGAGDNVVRLLPPLTITLEEINIAVKALESACEGLRATEKTMDKKVEEF